jgi:N-acetylglucosaminyldiphosphoundecaprenol N-acetyl-beta-D-mannosaminyltransferase
MNLLDIRIDEINKIQALSKITEFLNSPKQHMVFTPNPEMLVKAQKDTGFKIVLNSGDLNLCDGMGVQLFTGIKRIPGVDFMLEVCKLAAEQGKGVYLLGSGNEDVVRKACENLHAQFPNLPISGYNKGPVLSEASTSDDSMITDEINRTGAQILFVAFGMGKQEKWIYENLAKMPNIKVAMGVGGSFDFISGHIKRAPLFLRILGLEWVYRLIQQPQRIGRIFNATVVFVYLVVKSYIYGKKA